MCINGRTQKHKREIIEDAPQSPDREKKIADRYYFAHSIWYRGYVGKIFLRLYGFGGLKTFPERAYVIVKGTRPPKQDACRTVYPGATYCYYFV